MKNQPKPKLQISMRYTTLQLTTISLEMIYSLKFVSEVLKLKKKQNFQTISNGKSTKTKVVDLDENNNFLVDEFFI